MQREGEENKAPTTQPWLAPPAAMAISARERQAEEQNRQTGRILLGMLLGSFLSGFFAAIFGLKKR